jgi:hypothetical protein
LRQIKSISPTDIHCGYLADLHRSLGPVRIRTPHIEIFAVARLSAVNRSSDTIERRGGSLHGILRCMLAHVFLRTEGSCVAQVRALARYGRRNGCLARQQNDYQETCINHIMPIAVAF